MTLPPPRPTPFPYTTLFRSCLRTRVHPAQVIGDLVKGSGQRLQRAAQFGDGVERRLRGEVIAGFLERDAGLVRQRGGDARRSEEHTSELQSRRDLVCRLLLE